MTILPTPGPWIVSTDDYGMFIHPKGREGLTLAQPSCMTPDEIQVGREANAMAMATGANLLAQVTATIAKWRTEAAKCMERADPDNGDEDFWYVTSNQLAENANTLEQLIENARKEATA